MSAMTYCYEYPHPALTTDIVVFQIEDRMLKVLLIKRGQDPHKGKWALPGGFMDIDEGLDACAKRELEEETGLSGMYLEQLYTFGAPQRDPRERIVSVAYFAVLRGTAHAQAASDAAEAKWFDLSRLPRLAFDHRTIVNMAYERLVAKLHYSTIALQFLAPKFSLGEIQIVYETILNDNLDKRNFRKGWLSKDCLEETADVRKEGNHRPAKLYRAKQPAKVLFLK